ncbi:MAG: HAMP domain-containing sensor histidine kinase [Planctomycetota bacterium]
MLLLLAMTIALLTYTSIQSIITVNRSAQQERMQRLVELLETSRLPVNSSILEDMKLLSGAEFLLMDNDEVIAQTTNAPTVASIAKLSSNEENQTEPSTIEIDRQSYLLTSLRGIQDRQRRTTNGVLHIFIPSQSDQSIWWQASRSPLTTALIVFPIALLLSLALASQVTRPLAILNHQVQQIAEANLQTIPVVRRNDEIRDLNVSINEMASKLKDHEVQLRKNERLRTMVQLGSGIAHHLRNSATGCKLAVELLAGEQQNVTESENYQVALRQLGLMDSYIKKMLLLSKSTAAEPGPVGQPVDLAEILEEVEFLLRPTAEHLGVKLSVVTNCDDSATGITEEDGRQLMMNLIANAIRAASENRTSDSSTSAGKVSVDLQVDQGSVQFSVIDNGTGPPADLADRIFDPFVTGSPEGTGLGLSLVRDISERVGGKINWTRDHQLTQFRFESTHSEEAIG